MRLASDIGNSGPPRSIKQFWNTLILWFLHKNSDFYIFFRKKICYHWTFTLTWLQITGITERLAPSDYLGSPVSRSPTYTIQACCCCLVTKSCQTLLRPGPWTADSQVPLSMGFPSQEYWNGLSFSSLEDLPNPGIKPKSPALAGGFFTTESLGKSIFLKENAFQDVTKIYLQTNLDYNPLYN